MTTHLSASRPSGELRLVAKVAWMYHEEGQKQDAIAQELHLSQSKVSRLLKVAAQEGIVRTIVQPPPGVFTELEAEVEHAFGLEECVLVENRATEAAVLNDLGAAAADLLMASLLDDEIVGISSWSATWVSAAQHMRRFRTPVASHVVQLVGGVGSPQVQTQATLLLDRFARVMGAEPVFMQTPGVLGDDRSRDILMADPTIKRVTDLWNRLTIALIGIGSVEPSPLLRESGNVMPDAITDHLRSLGGVGDICNRYFDAEGRSLEAGIDGRVAGITLEQLRRIPRRVAAAGGVRKVGAIRGALAGGWVTTLITDADTARALVTG
ncbi:MAG: sugar-binding transcriptional regulator [Propionibacteriaceae bacterium]|nr:sugar-binding transcriptional regulator [Propionibacteriaceae bacterium]